MYVQFTMYMYGKQVSAAGRDTCAGLPEGWADWGEGRAWGEDTGDRVYLEAKAGGTATTKWTGTWFMIIQNRNSVHFFTLKNRITLSF